MLFPALRPIDNTMQSPPRRSPRGLSGLLRGVRRRPNAGVRYRRRQPCWLADEWLDYWFAMKLNGATKQLDTYAYGWLLGSRQGGRGSTACHRASLARRER
jgi:hypothetical protein